MYELIQVAENSYYKVLEVAVHIIDLCIEPLCFEVILQRLFEEYGLTMSFEQYALVGSTVRSYLAWLKDSGKLEAAFLSTQRRAISPPEKS